MAQDKNVDTLFEVLGLLRPQEENRSVMDLIMGMGGQKQPAPMPGKKPMQDPAPQARSINMNRILQGMGADAQLSEAGDYPPTDTGLLLESELAKARVQELFGEEFPELELPYSGVTNTNRGQKLLESGMTVNQALEGAKPRARKGKKEKKKSKQKLSKEKNFASPQNPGGNQVDPLEADVRILRFEGVEDEEIIDMITEQLDMTREEASEFVFGISDDQ